MKFKRSDFIGIWGAPKKTKKAIGEILEDTSTCDDMRRILVCNVSSGKTMVSQASAYACTG